MTLLLHPVLVIAAFFLFDGIWKVYVRSNRNHAELSSSTAEGEVVGKSSRSARKFLLSIFIVLPLIAVFSIVLFMLCDADGFACFSIPITGIIVSVLYLAITLVGSLFIGSQSEGRLISISNVRRNSVLYRSLFIL